MRKQIRLAVAGVAVVVAGAVGGLLAVDGQAPRTPAAHVIQRADSTTPTSVPATTVPPTPATTAVPDGGSPEQYAQSAQGSATQANTSAQQAAQSAQQAAQSATNAGTTTTTTTTTPACWNGPYGLNDPKTGLPPQVYLVGGAQAPPPAGATEVCSVPGGQTVFWWGGTDGDGDTGPWWITTA